MRVSNPFLTATELLLGEHPSREEVTRAGKLFEVASSQGQADASERCAMFEAFGMARPQNWDRALDYLVLAAAQGSLIAREQILLLADESRDPEPPDTSDELFWKQVRGTIDLDARMLPREKTALSDRPRIRVIKAFATPAECRWLIGLARNRVAPATVFDEETGGRSLDRSRNNSILVLQISEMNVFTEVIRHRIARATRLPTPLFEPAQLLHYAAGERFEQHHDFLDPANPAYREDLVRFGQRIATFLVYLNGEYLGGETIFPAINLSFRGQTGDALFFANVTQVGAPDPLTLHAGQPPTTGEKWVFSQWIRGQLPSS